MIFTFKCEIYNRDGHQFHKYRQNDTNHSSPQIIEHKKTMAYADGNPDLGIGRTQKCGGAKQINVIPSPSDSWIYNGNTNINNQ